MNNEYKLIKAMRFLKHNDYLLFTILFKDIINENNIIRIIYNTHRKWFMAKHYRVGFHIKTHRGVNNILLLVKGIVDEKSYSIVEKAFMERIL